MLKVSISLPGGTVIAFEASEPLVLREMVALALRETLNQLPTALVRPEADGIPTVESDEKCKLVNAPPPQPGSVTPGPAEDGTESDESFVRFCHSLAPLGDMRRVVVAAEGATRFLNIETVSVRELKRLFDLAEWRHPDDFLQTLRNAGRSKFRWLERVRGRSGYYGVTDTGREKVIGPAEPLGE